MKKSQIHIIFSLVAVALWASCSKESRIDEGVVEITISRQDDAQKGFAPGGWSDNDRMIVLDLNGETYDFTMLSHKEGTATFCSNGKKPGEGKVRLICGRNAKTSPTEKGTVSIDIGSQGDRLPEVLSGGAVIGNGRAGAKAANVCSYIVIEGRIGEDAVGETIRGIEVHGEGVSSFTIGPNGGIAGIRDADDKVFRSVFFSIPSSGTLTAPASIAVRGGAAITSVTLHGTADSYTFTPGQMTAEAGGILRISNCLFHKKRPSLTLNLENDSVRSYMDYVYANPYLDGDYSYTYIGNYYKNSTSYRKDRPAPARITWTKSSLAATGQTVTVFRNASLTDTVAVHTVSGTASSVEVWNLIPGMKYHYTVEADRYDGRVLIDSYHFFTEGRRRLLNIDGVFNVRDLGGIRTADGSKRIRYGRIFRGGRMNMNNINISEKGKESMRRAGIAADLDLRKDDEAGNITSSPLGKDIEYIRFPTSSKGYYEKIRTSDAKVNIRELQWIIDNLKASRPVYFHCAVGADRTGTLGFLIEGLLGVSELDLSIDYELTSFSEAGYRPRKKDKYDYPGLVAALKTVNGTNFQEKFYNYFLNGIGGVRISKSDLDWFIGHMLEE